MRIRDARLDDAAALSRFARDVFVDTFGHLYPPQDLKAFLWTRYTTRAQRAELRDPRIRYRLAVDDDDVIVGYSMVGPLSLPTQGEGLELSRLYVDRAVQGTGVAARLMDDVIAYAREQGAPALYLSVYENNERAKRFYRRYGFIQVGEYDFFVGRARDRDLIWRLDLSAAPA
ncbi:MAG TPA: GNAT family N-acetyltransferase [Longimicrobiales bacterium]